MFSKATNSRRCEAWFLILHFGAFSDPWFWTQSTVSQARMIRPWFRYVLIFSDCYSRVGILITTNSYISSSQRFCMMYFTPQLFILYNLIISRNSSIAVMVVLLSHFMYMSNVWNILYFDFAHFKTHSRRIHFTCDLIFVLWDKKELIK